MEGSIIVYTATVAGAEELATWLWSQGVDAALYHGKRKTADRKAAQDDFMSGNKRLIVATAAFGLGIDKPDVRAVVHYNFPDSLESYYQEAGRAGRDGAPARAVLLYRLEDRRVQAYFLGGKYPKRKDTIMRYAQSTECRVKRLAEYFGEEYGDDCLHCDNCRDRPAENAAKLAHQESLEEAG